jgi:hypothetical protein
MEVNSGLQVPAALSPEHGLPYILLAVCSIDVRTSISAIVAKSPCPSRAGDLGCLIPHCGQYRSYTELGHDGLKVIRATSGQCMWTMVKLYSFL